MILTFSLPIPVTVNKLYRPAGNGRRILTEQARTYRAIAGLTASHAWTMAGQPKLDPPFGMSIDIWWGDARRRDVDNVVKACWDAVCPALGFDDASIWYLELTRRGIDRDNPRLDVVLYEYRHAALSSRSVSLSKPQEVI